MLMSFSGANARKVRQSLKIVKEKGSDKKNSDNDLGKELPADEDSFIISHDGRQIRFSPDSISFAGYEKEAGAASETMIIVNRSEATVTAIRFKITYLDMQDRMLHSRILTLRCHVPSHENRKCDFKSWDTQHTYFHYLGNEPRKLATPYKIEILPLAFFVEN